MGNQNSTIQLSSTNPTVNGLYLYDYPSLASAVVTAESDPTRRTRFIFSNTTQTYNGFIASDENPTKAGLLDLTRANQLLIFSRTVASGSNQRQLQCLGNDNTRTISCYNATVNGQALNRFYTCNNGPGAAVYIGVNVPGNCNPAALTYTPRRG